MQSFILIISLLAGLVVGANYGDTLLGTGGGVVAPSAGGVTVGNAVTSGTADRVLFEDSANLVAESANLTFDGTTLTVNTLSVSGTGTTTYTGGIDADSVDSNKGYSIADAVVLTATRLGGAVVESSLTSVATLTGGATGAGFTVDLNASSFTCSTCILAGDYAAASIDGDDIASGIAGRSLTLTVGGPDVLDVDAELFTKIFSINVASTSMSTTTEANDNSGVAQHRFAKAVTLTDISCSTDKGTADIDFGERASTTPNSAGTDVLSGNLRCDTNSEASSDFANPSIAEYAVLNLHIPDAEPTGIKPTIIRIHVTYTIDD